MTEKNPKYKKLKSLMHFFKIAIYKIHTTNYTQKEINKLLKLDLWLYQEGK